MSGHYVHRLSDTLMLKDACTCVETRQTHMHACTVQWHGRSDCGVVEHYLTYYYYYYRYDYYYSYYYYDYDYE